MAQKPKIKAKVAQPTQPVAAPQAIDQEDAQIETQAFLPAPVAGNRIVQTSIQPHYPAWPSSKPGPQKTQPPVGTKSFNALRREQVTEITHPQNTHTSTENSSNDAVRDESLTAQDASRTHKKRIE